jgi:hypothetical protein
MSKGIMKNEKLEINDKSYFNKIAIFTIFVLYFFNQLNLSNI